MSNYNYVSIEYQKEQVFCGNICSENYLSVIDALFSHATLRFEQDSLGHRAKEASLVEVDFGWNGYLLLVVSVVGVGPANYVYIAQGKHDVLDAFRCALTLLNNLKNSYEFTVEARSANGNSPKRVLHKGDKLALVDCANLLYRDALLEYARSASVVEKSVVRQVNVLDSGNNALEVDVAYNKESVRYKLLGSVGYIMTLDYYFKGIYEDFDNALREGEYAAATVCCSVEEIGDAYGVDAKSCIWMPFRMDGTLTGEEITLVEGDEILLRATRFCKLSVPNFNEDTEVHVTYVCNESRKKVKRKRDGSLMFVIGGEGTLAVDVYAKVYVKCGSQTEHFITYRYRMQDKISSI